MNEQYDGVHSVIFGELEETGLMPSYSRVVGKNSWDDWHLIPSSRPYIAPPSPNTKTIAVPGRNGVLDLSTILTGFMTYQNRTGSIELIVANDYWGSWANAYSEIMSFLHGEKLKCILTDDPGYFYEGLFTVSSWKSDKDYSTITINYDLYPYKRSIQTTREPWLWDPFSFETGVIREYGGVSGTGISVAQNSSKQITLINGEEAVTPKVYCSSSSNMVMSYVEDGVTKQFALSSGENVYPGFKLKSKEEKTVTFTNNGGTSRTVYISFRAGEF